LDDSIHDSSEAQEQVKIPSLFRFLGRGVAKGRRTRAIQKRMDYEQLRIGRGERIRTSDPLVPNQVLYQAEPRPVIA
jgi:hypothetical protein